MYFACLLILVTLVIEFVILKREIQEMHRIHEIGNNREDKKGMVKVNTSLTENDEEISKNLEKVHEI